VVGVLGLLADVTRRVRSGFTRAADVVLLLGTTEDEFGGSEWAWVAHGHLGGPPPRVRLSAEMALSQVVQHAARENLLGAAHDVSDGGLAQTLVELALLDGIGATVTLDGDPFVLLFAESTARAVVTCADTDLDRVLTLASDVGLPVARLGRCGGDSLQVTGLFDVSLDELRAAHESTLPSLFG
jgi:phosphoribosylformylglycinamidine synthase